MSAFSAVGVMLAVDRISAAAPETCADAIDPPSI
jgi:hypothetical protein